MHAVLLSAKHRNDYCISTSLFPSSLHHHCLQILYTTNFLREKVFFISCELQSILLYNYGRLFLKFQRDYS